MGKKFILTEQQVNVIMSQMLCEGLNDKQYPIDPDNVLIVKEFLDHNFRRGKMDVLGEDGLPSQSIVIAMVNPAGEVMKNMYKEDVLELLVDKFKDMFLDHDYRRKFLGQVMNDWYDNKIGLYGSLSVNHL